MKIFPKKSLGQNFLIDEKILNLIAETGNINNEDIVFEVGPGTGKLTEKIIDKKPKEFVVVEKDNKLAEFLKEKFLNNVKIVNQDILKFSYKNYHNKKLVIFGNLPYNISTQILISWIKLNNLKSFCKKFILMFQKEVADRIIAETNSKEYGRLSILSCWKMNIKKVIDIEPKSFYPKPKVSSTLLTFEPKTNFYKLKNIKNLEHVTNIFFSNRRKMIKKPMKILFKDFNNVANSLSIDLKTRPQNLTRQTYYKICSNYEKLLY